MRRSYEKSTELSAVARGFLVSLLLTATLTPAHAQTETVLHSFAGIPDGSGAYAALTPDRFGNLYGTTSLGGVNGYGAVFKIGSSGEEFGSDGLLIGGFSTRGLIGESGIGAIRVSRKAIENGGPGSRPAGNCRSVASGWIQAVLGYALQSAKRVGGGRRISKEIRELIPH
jgi:uncharacterized repeat protein (TIGR03803 family)